MNFIRKLNWLFSEFGQVLSDNKLKVMENETNTAQSRAVQTTILSVSWQWQLSKTNFVRSIARYVVFVLYLLIFKTDIERFCFYQQVIDECHNIIVIKWLACAYLIRSIWLFMLPCAFETNCFVMLAVVVMLHILAIKYHNTPQCTRT